MPAPTTPRLPDTAALLASLLSQMTRFSCLGCPQQAAQIRRELALLQGYPDEQIPPLLKQVARRLEAQWGELHLSIADENAPEALHTASQRALH